jgi:hypothetical protein
VWRRQRARGLRHFRRKTPSKEGDDVKIRKVLVPLAVVCLGAGAFAGYAYSSRGDDNPPNQGEAGSPEPAHHDAPALRANEQIRLMVMTQNDAFTVSNTSFANFTADTIRVPGNGTFRVVVRFSAESACSAASWCSARITVDGVEANPKSGGDFAFDSPGGETWQSLSMDRTSDKITGTGAARDVVVAVDVAVIGGGSWRLDDWSVVTELSRIS